jgi:lipopolysaccharide biosynthesis glycosyltransferase
VLPIYVGYDPREAISYSVFCHSVIEQTSIPVCFIPLTPHIVKDFDGQRDGSNSFIYSRFLIPWLQRYRGWAVYADGDMLCRTDIAELIEQCRSDKDVFVAKHDYKTKFPVKYLGARNMDYPRKNWSSLMVINCDAPAWRPISPAFVNRSTGADLHRLSFLQDERIGALPLDWNWLVSEYDYNEDAKIAHFTVGGPWFKEYGRCDYAPEWHKAKTAMLHANQREKT